MTNKKELCLKINKITCEDWIKVAEGLGLTVTHRARGGSHYSIRYPSSGKTDVRGVLTSLTPNSCCAATNHKIYKRFLNAGYDADIINSALGIKWFKEATAIGGFFILLIFSDK